MTTKVVVPQLGESVVDATIARWHKQEGEAVAVGDVLVELETDKVDVEVGADKAGVLARIERQEGEDVAVGDVLGLIEENGAAGVETRGRGEGETRGEEDAGTRAERDAETGRGGEKAATPVAKRIAREEQIDLAQVAGSGSGGRVTKQDVQGYLTQQKEVEVEKQAPAERDEAQPTAVPKPEPPRVGQPEREERVRLSRRRRTIAQRLVEVQRTAAMLTTFNEIDMSAVIEIRHRRKESFKERHGIGLGLSAFFVKATIGALKAFPSINAEIQGDEMVLKHYYDIGVAIGAEEGLVVPVLRDADRISFADIERAIKDFAQRATNGTLTLDDLRGGTFTITNGGVFGSLLSTPILNPPQVGILGMHKFQDRPVVHNGEVVIRPMMYVALTYDHRIVDGREAVQFLVRVKELIEDPENLLLEG